MYCEFFGFSEKPFEVTPDPDFLYLTSGHRETLAALIYGIRERRGFVVVVGEVGTGKTTLLNAALSRLDRNISFAFIFNTNVTFDGMLSMALLDLKLANAQDTLTRAEAVRRLNDLAIRQFSRGGNVVLLLDEAQNLDRSEMENLRLLSNLETGKHKLIQIVLSGQPELDRKLNQPELRQLCQRIAIKRYVMPLTKKETYEYIQHRLQMTNYNGPPLFSCQARKIIWEYSAGVPRRINILCDNALLIAYALRQKTINSRVIREAMRDLSWSPFSGAREAGKQDLRSVHSPPTPGPDYSQILQIPSPMPRGFPEEGHNSWSPLPSAGEGEGEGAITTCEAISVESAPGAVLPRPTKGNVAVYPSREPSPALPAPASTRVVASPGVLWPPDDSARDRLEDSPNLPCQPDTPPFGRFFRSAARRLYGQTLQYLRFPRDALSRARDKYERRFQPRIRRIRKLGILYEGKPQWEVELENGQRKYMSEQEIRGLAEGYASGCS